jgi:hypothetical protein
LGNAKKTLVHQRFCENNYPYGGYFPETSTRKTWYVSALYNRQVTASEFVFGGALELSEGMDETSPVNVYISVLIFSFPKSGKKSNSLGYNARIFTLFSR